MSSPSSARSVWRFLVPLLLQIALIASIPAQALYTHLSGKTAILKTFPIEPDDLALGNSKPLRYEISAVENLEKLPGWQTVLSPTPTGEKRLVEKTRIYVILQEPAPPNSNKKSSRPQPWKAVSIGRDRPSDLPENRVALAGIYHNGWIDYGLEHYSFPEAERAEVNQTTEVALRKARKDRSLAVRVKVDRQGKSIAQSLWVGDREFKFE